MSFRFNHQENLRQMKVLFIKDLFLERGFRYFIPACCFFSCGLLLWSAFAPQTALLPGLPIDGISAVSQHVIVVTIMMSYFIPLVLYMNVIQGEKRSGSFLLWRTLPVSLRTLLWGRIVTCWTATMIPVCLTYVLFVFLYAVNVISADLLTPTLLDVRFPFFAATLAFLLSVFAVGLPMITDAQILPFITTSIAISMVMFPFVFSRMVAGTDSQFIMVRFAQIFGTVARISLLMLLLSLLLGGGFDWLLRRKRSYI